MLARLYTRRDLIVGLSIYGAGDAVAAMLAGQFSVVRAVGMALIGALVYGAEIPHYFRWVDGVTRHVATVRVAVLRTALALLYFNPLWVARHLLFIALFSGKPVDGFLVVLAAKSFITALPLTIGANLVIQNVISLPRRFLASALFSCLMAAFYPLLAGWLGSRGQTGAAPWSETAEVP
jgi:hypothetical protein